MSQVFNNKSKLLFWLSIVSLLVQLCMCSPVVDDEQAKKWIKKDDFEPNESTKELTCQLCKENFHQFKDYCLECNHMFHEHCLVDWVHGIKDKPRGCPICNQDVVVKDLGNLHQFLKKQMNDCTQILRDLWGVMGATHGYLLRAGLDSYYEYNP